MRNIMMRAEKCSAMETVRGATVYLISMLWSSGVKLFPSSNSTKQSVMVQLSITHHISHSFTLSSVPTVSMLTA